MKPTAEQTKELSELVQRLRADIPNVVNAMVPPEHRVATLRVMMATVPPMYASMALEKMHGTPPGDAQACAMYALAVGVSGIIGMTARPGKHAEAAAAMIKLLDAMLREWAAADELPLSKPH
jgi:hypothetical protein